MVVRRLSDKGSIEWEDVFEKVSGAAAGLHVLDDGSTIVAGVAATGDPTGAPGLALLRLVAPNEMSWSTLASEGAGWEARGMEVTSDRIAVAGLERQLPSGVLTDGFVAAFSHDGTQLWSTTVGGPLASQALFDLAPHPDGGWMAVGEKGKEGWVVRLDSEGEVLVDTTIQPSTIYESFLRSVCSFGDGTHGIGGLFGMQGNNDAAWIGRIDAAGIPLFNKQLPQGLMGFTYDAAQDCVITKGGRMVFTGDRTQPGGSDTLLNDLFVTRLDGAGSWTCD